MCLNKKNKIVLIIIILFYFLLHNFYSRTKRFITDPAVSSKRRVSVIVFFFLIRFPNFRSQPVPSPHRRLGLFLARRRTAVSVSRAPPKYSIRRGCRMRGYRVCACPLRRYSVALSFYHILMSNGTLVELKYFSFGTAGKKVLSKYASKPYIFLHIYIHFFFFLSHRLVYCIFAYDDIISEHI